MGLIEQSAAGPEVLAKSDMVRSRLAMARTRLRMDILVEMVKLGVPPLIEDADKIIDGLPAAVLDRELAART